MKANCRKPREGKRYNAYAGMVDVFVMMLNPCHVGVLESLVVCGVIVQNLSGRRSGSNGKLRWTDPLLD